MKNLLALSLLAAVPLVSIAQTSDVTLFGRVNFSENWDVEAIAGKVAVSQGQSSAGKTYGLVHAQKFPGEPVQARGYEGQIGGGLSQVFDLTGEPQTKRAESFVGNGDWWMMSATQFFGQPASYAMFVGTSLAVVQGVLQASFYPPQPPTSGLPQVNFDNRLRIGVRYGRPWMDTIALNGNNFVNNTFAPEVWGIRYKAGQVERTYVFTPPPSSEVASSFGQLDVAGQDGSKVAVGTRCRVFPNAEELMCLQMLELIGESAEPNAVAEVDPPPKVSLDTSFGVNGRVVIRHPDPTQTLRYFQHAFDPEERLVIVYGVGRPGNTFVPTLLRLRKDGSVDTSFGTNGTVVIPTTGLTTQARNVTIDIHGNIVVTGETYTQTTVRPFIYFHYKTSAPGAPETYGAKLVEHAIPGKENSTFFKHIREPDGTITAVGTTYLNYPNINSARPLLVRMEGPAGAVKAIEYFHANFGHYATIVNPAEAAKLDSGEIAGWARTNRLFWVYPLGTAHTTNVDRFFSTSFAKSSHVYTANAAESAAIKQNPDWLFEGTVFGAILPNAGKCPGALRPVTRIYNNGVTGAPNHQFTDNPLAIALALGRGGVLEGEGPAAAVYCTE